MFQATTATHKLTKLNKRIRAVAGGTSASKTISILMLLIDYCQTHENKTVHVVSESYPHLKDGAMKDFTDIMVQHKYWNDTDWNKTDHEYDFGSTKLKFISVDKFGKAHGPRRDVLFINEANNIDYQIADQLITRTRDFIWLDWNPASEYWFYTEMLNKRTDIDFVTLTYLDNEALDTNTKNEIESHRANKNWWQVYGLGQLGEIESRIYKDWLIIDEIPHEARLERYGLDFGYSNDPTTIDAIYRYNGGFIIDEITHQKGLSNKQIADILTNQPKALVLADSAEPKSIDEIASYGVSILPSVKGQGSISRGINYVQYQRISVTKRSINVIKEYRNYLWQTDKDGKIINEPDVGFDHHMDAIRYAIESLKPQENNVRVAYNSKKWGIR